MIRFVFNNDNTCIAQLGDSESDTTQTFTGMFRVDFSKKPIPLTITQIPQLNHPLYTIIEFVGKDSIRMAAFSSRWRLRPIAFETSKTIHLCRKANDSLR
jgi:hypothetical protein